MNRIFPLLFSLGLAMVPMAGAPALKTPGDWAACQADITNGRAAAALERLADEAARHPSNSRLQYDLGVAAYAAGRYEEALLAWDHAESTAGSRLARLTRFQQGNAEYRLGLAARASNLDDTIARWKESLRHFAAADANGTDPRARTNSAFVQRQLLELLLNSAKTNLTAAQPAGLPMDRKLDSLRNAFIQYSDAKELAPENTEAGEGEQQSRDQLAQNLAKEGSRKANTARWVQPKPNEAPIPHPDFKEINDGLAMLEDANQLKPKDEAIKKALDDARKRLADALADSAENMLQVEPRVPWPNEKLALLRMAKEQVNQALAHVPEHERAQRDLEAINRRLAEVMEQRGDELSSQSDHEELEQQAQSLSQSLDFFQQASDLRPDRPQLPQKAEATQKKLEQSLDKLADKLMQPQGASESLEGKAARLEGADQALTELERLSPSPRTSQRAEAVEKELDGVRQQMAKQGQPATPGGNQPDPKQPGQGNPQFSNGLPIDTPPKINTPGVKGPWNSPVMSKTQDY
jgi:hypothetical protein